jgi:transposase
MKDIHAIGVDLSKSVIHVHAADERGRLLWRKKLKHEEFGKLLGVLPVGRTVYMEACGSAHFWSRKAERQGLKARQIAPQHVKPFVKSQKNDYHDAEAVLEAGLRPSMRYVTTKSVEQQELQAVHCVRSRRIAERTALLNQIRGILLEHGVTVAQGAHRLKKYLATAFMGEQEVSPALREIVGELQEELAELERRISVSEKRILDRAKACPLVQRLMTIPGIGLLSATALAVVSGNPKEFKNGRQFAAWLGLVPRQMSSGGKPTLLGISKRGDTYVRSLLIHGGRAVVRHALEKNDPHSLWIRKLHAAKGMNPTAVAVANKNARIAWRIMTSNEEYDPALPHAAFVIQ